jgi:hypothetical protein
MMRIFRRIRNQFDKEMRAYYKMRRKHRKELIKLAKEDRDSDWEYMHTLIITKIRHMHEYFSAGNNVWQTDETLLPIIEELKHVLDMQAEMDKEVDGRFYIEKRVEQYKAMYEYIASKMLGWWD